MLQNKKIFAIREGLIICLKHTLLSRLPYCTLGLHNLPELEFVERLR